MSVANSYAKAFYEAATDAKATAQDLDALESQLSSFVELTDGSKELQIALFGPLISAKEKADVMAQITKKAGYSPLLSNLLGLLARKGRLQLIGEIRQAFREVRLLAEGGVPAKLVAAEAMSNEDIEGLAKTLAKKLGKRVAFQVSTDPSLLAGVKVTVNGVTYDGTLRSQLQRLSDRLTSGSSH